MNSVTVRSKGHMLVHSALDIARFGLLVNVMTEAFEGLNKHCRQRFAYSNNRAPGRDTAIDFAKIQTANFVLDGGQWRHSDEAGYAAAGAECIGLAHHPAFSWRHSYTRNWNFNLSTRKTRPFSLQDTATCVPEAGMTPDDLISPSKTASR